jgi:alpha-methylacyl-CoA racemase
MTGPLRGVRVVMTGGLGPGPFCGMLLGDLGAEVVRVDQVREVDRELPIDYTVRRNQRSIAVNLKDSRGPELVRRLVADADAFVDVFRPGVAERLGIGPDELLDANPRLVYARMTGYGQDGPYADRAGHDINYIALTGALHGIGTAENPVPPLNLIGDYGGGGMMLAIGLLSAILDARQSGEGQVLDVAMVDGAATMMAPYYGMVHAGTWRDHRCDNILDGAAHFSGVYRTATTSTSRSARSSRSSMPSSVNASRSTCHMMTMRRRCGVHIEKHWRPGSYRRRVPSGSSNSAHPGHALHRC